MQNPFRAANLMAASHFGARRKRQFAAQHYGPIGDGLVRWLYGAAAGAINRLAASPTALANPNDDRVRTGADPVRRTGSVQAASGDCTENGRRAIVAYYEQ